MITVTQYGLTLYVRLGQIRFAPWSFGNLRLCLFWWILRNVGCTATAQNFCLNRNLQQLFSSLLILDWFCHFLKADLCVTLLSRRQVAVCFCRTWCRRKQNDIGSFLLNSLLFFAVVNKTLNLHCDVNKHQIFWEYGKIRNNLYMGLLSVYVRLQQNPIWFLFKSIRYSFQSGRPPINLEFYIIISFLNGDSISLLYFFSQFNILKSIETQSKINLKAKVGTHSSSVGLLTVSGI